MKILMAVHGYPPKNVGGTEIYTHDLAQALAEKHDVFVGVRGIGNYEKPLHRTRAKDGAVNLIYLYENKRRGEETTFRNPDLDKLFGEVLDEIKPDIIHIQHFANLSYGFIAEGRRRNIPMIAAVADYFPMCSRFKLVTSSGEACSGPDEGKKCGACRAPELPGGMRTAKPVPPYARLIARIIPKKLLDKLYSSWMLLGKKQTSPSDLSALFMDRNSYIRQQLRQADVIHCISDHVRERLKVWGLPQQKLKTIEWGYDGQSIKIKGPTIHKPLRFGYLGTLTKEKGIETFLRAAQEIPHVHFFVYGQGDPRYIAELKERFPGKHIFFMGAYGQDTINDVLTSIDIQVIPSQWEETLGIVVMEGILASKPLIVSSIPAYRRWVSDGKNGLLFRPGNSSELKECMQWMIDNHEKIITMPKRHPAVKTMRIHALEIQNLYASLTKS